MKYIAVILLLSATLLGGCVIIDAGDYRDLNRDAAGTRMNARETPQSAHASETAIMVSTSDLPPSTAE